MLMSEVVEKPVSGNSAPSETPSVEVYAVYGVEPEIQAYAMAKYSRSALSMKESLREISQQKAEKFLNTFYFQYGHRSIADLAHIALAIERLSILAAIAAADEQRWDGQERSTRYQDFKKSGYYVPEFGEDRTTRPPKGLRKVSTRRQWIRCSRSTKRSRTGCFSTWPPSHRNPLK
jgi:thymidylate synthase ThyX